VPRRFFVWAPQSVLCGSCGGGGLACSCVGRRRRRRRQHRRALLYRRALLLGDGSHAEGCCRVAFSVASFACGPAAASVGEVRLARVRSRGRLDAAHGEHRRGGVLDVEAAQLQPQRV